MLSACFSLIQVLQPKLVIKHQLIFLSIFQTHIRKMHSRDEYAFFRMIPTTDSPFVCQKCSWAFTNGAIKNHFHQVAAVCTKNRRTRDEIARKGLHETIKLIFAEPDPSPERTPEERIEQIFSRGGKNQFSKLHAE